MVKASQKPISQNLLAEIKSALESVNFGSIEIFVQNKTVTQITVRNIHKTSVEIESVGQETHVMHAHSDATKTSNIQSDLYIRKSSVKAR